MCSVPMTYTYSIFYEKKWDICGISATTASELCVDYDHKKGNKDPNAVRGLLCNDCNIGLGHFKDNTQWLINI